MHAFSKWLGLIFIAFFLIALSGCKNNADQAGETVAPEILAKYISGYTSGVIGKNDPVRLRFTEEVGDPATAVPNAMVSLTPSHDFTAKWEDTRTLLLTPTDAWAQGLEYTLSVELKSLFPDADDLRRFTTRFTIRETQLSVQVDGLYTPDPKVPAQQIITGSINGSDDFSVAAVEGLIQVTHAGKSLPVNYRNNPMNPAEVIFEVDGVARQQETTSALVSWDATRLKGLGDTKGNRELEVFSSLYFRVVSVRFRPEGDPHVEVRLSDPVDEQQDLTGLIELSGSITERIRIDANIIRLYIGGDASGTQTLRLAKGLKNVKGKLLENAVEWEVSFTRPDPALRAVSDGSIMPHSGQRLFPFEAIGLEAVRVEIFKVFANNVQQYLLNNQLEGQQYGYGLSSVGRIIHQERIELTELDDNGYDMDNWNRFAIDLSRFIETDDRAIYQVRIGFAMADTRKECGVTAEDFGISNDPATGQKTKQYVGFEAEPTSIMDGYYGIYDVEYEGFSWEDRDNPCKPAYYNADRFVSRNIISSNLGLIVKQSSDRQTVVLTTDILTGGPRAGANVSLYDEQQQLITQKSTDKDGRVILETDRQPVYITASSEQDVAYLRLNEQSALTTSRFNTSGTNSVGGVKGCFYAERGVWRPGDSIYLHFVLENRLNKLPANYPITFTLTDARGSVREQRTVTPEVGQIYPLHLTTSSEDPTGNWLAEVKAGGNNYRRYLKVETVKPNRLKIELDPEVAGPITRSNNVLNVKANWLYGAPAAGLRAEIKGQWQKNTNYFAETWPGYDFHDPAREMYDYEPTVYYDQTLSEQGTGSFQVGEMSSNLPGPMRLAFSSRVYEPGGNFSVDNVRYPVVTFPALAGISLPEDRWGEPRLPMGESVDLALSAVDAEGKGLSGRKLTVGLYKVNWRYWWQEESDNVGRFNSSRHEEALQTFKATSGADGRATVPVSVESWGRYLVRVCDDASGHCSGGYVYAGSPSWTETDKDAAAMLPLRMEDKAYKIGETAQITLASESSGMILLSLESGAGVLETRWIEATAGETVIPVKLNERMLPNVYACVMLIQPHAATNNGRPIRQYGIIPISVEDPATRLEPLIATAAEYAPEESFSVKVSEKNGLPMNYTLAVVDEGLLGLTRFQTPDLWDDFFAKEALSVRTYDLYNHVIGSMDGQFNRILAIGGDGENGGDKDAAKANRFEAVVRHLGPFTLAAGKTATHQMQMPNYIGAVRVMVVAEKDRRYGSADKSVPVRKDLMVLPTLPRVIAPGESMELPVNVFAMTDKIKKVTVSVTESSGLVDFKVAKQRAMTFSKPGDQLIRFPFVVGERTGVARFTVTAAGNGESISQEIEIQVENPNSFAYRNSDYTLAAGESRTINYAPFGTPESREATLEVSSLPSLNLDKHLSSLIRYPYGCAEQTTSPAFAQLYLNKLIELSPSELREIQQNVQAGINRLLSFQTSDGGMAYWPGEQQTNPWASNYVLHFLLEAENAGYTLPVNFKQRLLQHQRRAAANWRPNGDNDYYASSAQRVFDQAYRLYTLALASNADLGAMNRLRAASSMSSAAAGYLAAAYGLEGKSTVAETLIDGRDMAIEDYRELDYTFGSGLRDRAMLLSIYTQLGRKDAAGALAVRLARDVGKRSYLSTQEGAFALAAFAKYAEQNKSSGNQVSIAYTPQGGSSSQLGSATGMIQVALPLDGTTSSFTVKNQSGGTLYLSTITGGKPLPGAEEVVNKGLNLTVNYTDLNGDAIDVSSLKSGTDFVATYQVGATGGAYSDYRNLALRQIAASGWEITNERMDFLDNNTNNDQDQYARSRNGYDYRDFRDDRVFTFFNLRRGDQKTFRTRLTAAYPGRYYLPTQLAEAMYDQEITASVKGQWVEVTE